MGRIIRQENHETFPWIVFLHGWGQTKESLSVLADATSAFANNLLLDLPGFGDALLTHPYTIDDYIDDLVLALAKENIQPSLIVGHSFGGKIAAYYALKHPEVMLCLLAPSFQTPPWRFKIFFKKKMSRLCRFLLKHRLIKKMPTSLQGSRDFKAAQGPLRKTFKQVVHAYPAPLMHSLTKQVDLFIGQDDHEVTLSQMKKALTYLKHGQLFVITGNHFAYRRHANEIASLCRERLAKR